MRTAAYGAPNPFVAAKSDNSPTRIIGQRAISKHIKLAVAAAIVAAVHHAGGAFLLPATAFKSTASAEPLSPDRATHNGTSQHAVHLTSSRLVPMIADYSDCVGTLASRLAINQLYNGEIMIRIVAGVVTVAVGVTLVHAQNLDVIKQRRETMKSIAAAGVINFGMMKGNIPFDLGKLQAGLKLYQDEAPKLKTLFPDDSKTGGDTDARPKIWQSRAAFEAAADKFGAVAKAAASVITDEATLKAEYPKVISEGCNGCHNATDGFAPSLSESFKKLKP